jgi:2,5-furandicarboxylate decarboxylase 1
MQRDLRFHLNLLKSADRLLTVRREVDPKFELPAVMKAAEGLGKAIIFENVKGSRYPVVNNLLGSRDVVSLLFEARPEEVVLEWSRRVKNPIEPESASLGPVKEVIKQGSEVDLGELPLVTHSGKDAGPYITAGIAVARDPDTGIRNVSVNRMEYKGRNKLGIRMMPPQHLGLIQGKCEKRGKNLEIAVAIGSHPFDILAAATTVDYGVDEFSISGSLRGEPLQLAKCETVDV